MILNKTRIYFVAALVFSLWPGSVFADDYYVINNTFKNQKEAQEKAAVKGGWVLNTNFYDRLTPNLFVVVRGPFKTKKKANKLLMRLLKGGRYPGSYLKNAGEINIRLKLGNKRLSPQMIAALLGEIRIDVLEAKGGSNPCEPQEPYKDISLSYVTVARVWDEKKDKILFKPKEVQLDIGALREIKRTGQIHRMRICAE